MSHIVKTAKFQLNDAIIAAVKAAQSAGSLPEAELPDFLIEVPADHAHGDWASNIAMAGARSFKMAPIKIAEIIIENLALEGTYFEKCATAGPGFINFFYKKSFYADVLLDVEKLGEKYGESDFGGGKKVNVEFVSANPTGPMHLGNARGGALGDCLASVLQTAGYKAYREFYVNDAGNQLEKLKLSLDIRYRELFEENAPEMPEDSYHGEDIIEHAKAYAAEHGDALMKLSEEERRQALADYALPINIAKMKADMARYGIEYDCWFHESELHKNGAVDRLIDYLKEKGYTYEADGATWYKATEFGGEKDEVIIRSNGLPTYFAVDVAYHLNKFERGFDKLIDCLGADHHGHMLRMKTGIDALGKNSDAFETLLYQFVNLIRDGEPVRMSKRTGKAIQLGDLLDEVSRDAARFMFNLHEPNITMDFDLDLAIKQDAQNPVYYVQYAHARICSILRNLEAEGISPRSCSAEELELLTAPEEIELIRWISSYTDEIIRSAEKLDPSIITKYSMNLATLFHKFYNACRVKIENEQLMQARLMLCISTRTTLRNVLNLLKVSAPDSM